MAELKPCPFCGHMPIVEDCGDNRFFVRCKCGIAQDKLYGQRCDAVKRWNTRHPQPEQQTGEWIDGHRSRWDGTFHWFRQCNQCGYEREDDNSDKDSIFCPNCGAKMM